MKALSSDFSATPIPLMCCRLWLCRSFGDSRKQTPYIHHQIMFEGPSSAHKKLLSRCNRSVVWTFWTISDRFHQERDRAQTLWRGLH
jgi:hypothetical protein